LKKSFRGSNFVEVWTLLKKRRPSGEELHDNISPCASPDVSRDPTPTNEMAENISPAASPDSPRDPLSDAQNDQDED